MTPGKLNLICPQGSTFSKSLTYEIDNTPVDLSTHTARMQVRKRHSSKSPVIDLTTENGGMTVSSEGVITFLATSEDTALIEPGEYVYDLEIISTNGEVSRLIEGKFDVTPEVTR